MFSQFTQLKSLDLQQNIISMVEDGAFSGLSQLRTLLLQHNSLKTASEEILLPLPRLTYLRLYDNPWNCHCPLDSLVRKLQVPSNRNLGNYAKCAEPLSLKGQKLKKVSVDSLCDNEVDVKPGGEGGRPKPPPSKVKPEATSMCHTYMFPKPLLDCSNKGETTFCHFNILFDGGDHSITQHWFSSELQVELSCSELKICFTNTTQFHIMFQYGSIICDHQLVSFNTAGIETSHFLTSHLLLMGVKMPLEVNHHGCNFSSLL